MNGAPLLTAGALCPSSAAIDGAMRNTITFLMVGNTVEIDFSREKSIRPTTTLLSDLRSLPRHRGVKEGCAEGDCGACTVAIAEPSGEGTLRYRAVDSCLVFLPMIDGKQVITVENLRSPAGSLHPVQEAMVEHHFRIGSSSVESVMVGGTWMLWNRTHPMIDEEDVMTRAQNVAMRLWNKLT